MTTPAETKPKSAWSALAEKIPRLLSRDNGTDSLNRRIRKNRPEKESYRYCLYVKGGQCTLPECMCIDDWIKAGGMPAPVVLEALCKGREKELRRRCETILRNGGQKFMKFKDSFHESRFERLVQTQQILDKTVLSAVFLLTADRELWSAMKRNILRGRIIRFDSTKLTGIDETGYTLYGGAKDLYFGTRSLCLNDLTDAEIISSEAYELIVTAMAIKRYGTNVLSQ